MGQYYTPILSEADTAEKFEAGIVAAAYSHDYGNGLKLMEHSYVGNTFVAAIERELDKRPLRVVWAGDYADPESGDDLNLYGSMYGESGEKREGLFIQPRPADVLDKSLWDAFYWIRNATTDGPWESARYTAPDGFVDKIEELAKLASTVAADRPAYRYLVDLDTFEYVSMVGLPRDTYKWRTHPLPLLTAEGNGRGGGDYHDDKPGAEFVGRWARHKIALAKRKADVNWLTDGKGVEIKPGFCD